MENKNIDFRYETKDESRISHSRRRAFIIYQEKLYFIRKGSAMSHWEFCQKKFPKLSMEAFNQLTRGFYLGGDLVFYKDNFIYDDNVISEALSFINEIKKTLCLKTVRIYFGLVIGAPGEDWPKDYYYGDSLIDNTIIKK